MLTSLYSVSLFFAPLFRQQVFECLQVKHVVVIPEFPYEIVSFELRYHAASRLDGHTKDRTEIFPAEQDDLVGIAIDQVN